MTDFNFMEMFKPRAPVPTYKVGSGLTRNYFSKNRITKPGGKPGLSSPQIDYSQFSNVGAGDLNNLPEPLQSQAIFLAMYGTDPQAIENMALKVSSMGYALAAQRLRQREAVLLTQSAHVGRQKYTVPQREILNPSSPSQQPIYSGPGFGSNIYPPSDTDLGIERLPEPEKTHFILALLEGNPDQLDHLAISLDSAGKHKAAQQVRSQAQLKRQCSATSVHGFDHSQYRTESLAPTTSWGQERRAPAWGDEQKAPYWGEKKAPNTWKPEQKAGYYTSNAQYNQVLPPNQNYTSQSNIAYQPGFSNPALAGQFNTQYNQPQPQPTVYTSQSNVSYQGNFSDRGVDYLPEPERTHVKLAMANGSAQDLAVLANTLDAEGQHVAASQVRSIVPSH